MVHYCTLIAFFLGLSWVNAAQRSPALLWSPERSMIDFPDVSTVDSFTASDFYDQYLSPLMLKSKENAVIFLQDKLSVDDFTRYADVYSIDSDGGAFKNVKRLMEDHFSLEVPVVDFPHQAVEMLQKDFDGEVHTISEISQLEPLKLGESKRFLLVVNLHPTIGSLDEEKVISQNDALVGDITRHLQTRGIKYSALFTGKSAKSSNKVESSDEAQHSNRHLLATYVGGSRDNCTFMNVTDENGAIYIFVCKVKVCVKSKEDPMKCMISIDTLVKEDAAKSSERHNDTALVKLELLKVKGNNDTDYDVTINILVFLHQDRWVISRTSLDLKQSSGNENKTSITNATLINYDIDPVIPILYSFHCTKLQMFVETVKDTKYKQFSGTKVTLEGFQFQVFNITNERFFLAQDCVGFFTAGIWMGVLPGLLLISIMVYGTLMVLNLSVMDKFDDPKGKTITVTVAES